MLRAVVASLLLAAAHSVSVLRDTVEIPVEVNIGLLGFAADGAWQLELNAGELHGLLHRLLP